MKWWPWRWFGRGPEAEQVDELSEARARYQASLRQLRQTTAEIQSVRSASLDEVQRRVQNADALMQQAIGRRRMPSSG